MMVEFENFQSFKAHQLDNSSRFLVYNKEVKYIVCLEFALYEYANIKDFKEVIGERLEFTTKPETDEFDMVITLGGDGTILWAHRILNRESLPPFLCFDGGSLCFLSNFSNLKAK